MPNCLDERPSIQAQFDELGIPTDAPGFYDHPSFQAREASETDFLNCYAAFVRQGEYAGSYLDVARTTIKTVCEVLQDELAKDGRLGACIDISMVLSRILDRYGIWNYIIKGALVLDFPRQSGIPTLYLWPYDRGDFQAAHVWLHAPPFEIVDIALRYQTYKYDVDQYVPGMVLEEELKVAQAKDDELFSPEARAHFHGQGVPSGSLIEKVTPRSAHFWNMFPPTEVKVGRIKLKYIGIGISTSDRPLEEIMSLNLSGRTGIQIYEDLIRPRLG